MCHTGDDVTDVCGETLRVWRQTRGVYYCGFKIYPSTNSCGREVVEVPASEIQGENLEVVVEEIGVQEWSEMRERSVSRQMEYLLRLSAEWRSNSRL